MTNEFLWLNGAFCETTCGFLPATTAGHLLGWGVYTTLGVRNAQPLFVARHLARLRHDTLKTGLELAFSEHDLAAALSELIARNGVRDGIARITATQRGDGRWNNEQGSDLLILAHNAPPLKLDGLRLMLSPFRVEARRASAGIKSTSYLDFQLAWQSARAAGFDEALLCNSSGAICEAARANIFWVRDGALFTPALDSGCLPGIAREIILEIATREGIETHQGSFSVPELLGADEVFLTSSTNGPRSVAQFSEDGFDTGYASPGKVTLHLQKMWLQQTEQPDL